MAVPAWITPAARLGHVSTGTVHCLVGALALTAALDPGARATGSQGALYQLSDRPLGLVLLLGLGIGLVADALWQVVRSATNADLAGAGLRGALERLGWLLSGLTHLGLGVLALQLARHGPPGQPESHTKAWTASVMAVPFGRWLVALAGLALLAVAAVLIARAGAAALDPWLDLGRMAPGTRAVTRVLNGVGLATRAVVYSIIAGFLLLAALQANPRVARGVTGTLRAIRTEPYGAGMLAAVGAGFAANGVLEMIRARYRREVP